MTGNSVLESDQAVLDVAGSYLRDQVAPNAQEIDRNVEAMRAALGGLCRLDLMALRRPLAYGGPNLSTESVQVFQQTVARYSGALAFLQTQHQGVVGMIAESANVALREEYLPQMGDGRKLVGVGFSQLRRPGPPIMRAEPVDGGYNLIGHVPWVTGWQFYPEFVVGATLPDGRAVFGLVPLVETKANATTIRISEPMQLAAMSAANTVTVDFDGFFLAEERTILVREAGWIQNNDQINVAQQGAFALGCALAGLDVLKANAEKRKLDFAWDALEKLSREWGECRAAADASQARVDQETTEERLRIRAWQIDLAVRCAHAAVASSSGAANSIDHPAQRIYREALVFTVSAQTSAVMRATLERLTR